MVNLISTRDVNGKQLKYTDALLEGLAQDGGLYIPCEYPQISNEELNKLRGKTYPQVSFYLKDKLIGGDIPSGILKHLIDTAYSQPKFNSENSNTTPIRKVADNLYVQNLSLGPTAAFKDMALQQLGQEMNYVLDRDNKNLVILGATSGDTGSSAEAALKGLKKIVLFMLSPKVGMSDFQKAQMGQLTGGNIFNISVDGRFDDCQDLVKLVKGNPEFAHLGAVNSINWGRISSQVPYYFAGYLQATNSNSEMVDFVVPSGNFGNILAGYIAKRMGLPIRNLIIATNENNVLDKLVKTGIYEVTPSQITSSPSMDISKASNFERLLFDIVDRNPAVLKSVMEEFAKNGKVDLNKFGIREKLKKLGFSSGKSTHQDRLNVIKKLYDEAQTIIDPHTADGVKVALDKTRDIPVISMETALPVKFEDTIKEAIGFVPTREERFVGLENNLKGGAFHSIPIDAEMLKDYIRKNQN